MPDRTFQQSGERIAAAGPTVDWEKKSDRLYRMIDYAIKRHDWYEDQRNKTLTLALGLLGLSSFLVAGLLSASVNEMLWFRGFASFTLVSVVVTALLIIHKYAVGAQQKYTHRSLAD